jgi:hemerythrin superfamily protein
MNLRVFQGGNSMATKKRGTRSRARQSRAARNGKTQDATALLKADHREVEGFFKAFERSESATERQSLATKICNALKIHTQIEEEVFYPAFMDATGEQDIHDEALVEHEGAKKLIAEIESGAPGAPLFDAKVKVLSEMIKHHVKEEERMGGMFSKARSAKMDLDALGAALAARKQELERASESKRAGPRRASGAYMGAASMARSKGARAQARRSH